MSEQFTKDDLLYLIQNGTGEYYSYVYVSAMATQLLAEMDKPSVWDGAPDKANCAYVSFSYQTTEMGGLAYMRVLPKSTSRLAAEKRARELYEAGVDAIADEIEKKEAGE